MFVVNIKRNSWIWILKYIFFLLLHFRKVHYFFLPGRTFDLNKRTVRQDRYCALVKFRFVEIYCDLLRFSLGKFMHVCWTAREACPSLSLSLSLSLSPSLSHTHTHSTLSLFLRVRQTAANSRLFQLNLKEKHLKKRNIHKIPPTKKFVLHNVVSASEP